MNQAIGAVQRQPSDAAAWTKLAMIYEAYALLDLARQCYEQSVKLNGRDPKPWYHLALMRGEVGDVSGAVNAMRKVISTKSDYAPAHWRLGLWLLDQDDVDAAETAFRQATHIDPNDGAGWLGLARVHLRRQENRQAAAVLESLLNRSATDSAYANQLLATAYRRLGRIEEAQAAALRSRGGEAVWNDAWQYEVAQFRTDSTWRHEYARVLAARGRVDEAVAMLNVLINEQPRNADLLSTFGDIRRQAGDLEQATKLFEQALAIDPGDYRLHFNMALTCLDRARSRSGQEADALHQSAMSHLNRAAALNPSFADAHGLLGQMQSDRHQLDQAEASYRIAARCDAANPLWPYRIGLIQLMQGRWAEAAATLQTVTQTAPQFAEAFSALGAAKLKLGQLDDAERFLRRAVELRPDDPQIAAALRDLQAARAATIDSPGPRRQ